ncbi:pinin [Venturia canescens]|uniref:pinin n=1 Tax=Venturia canescens TaxID=32260 RepID=UPI001C9D1603|nr:pinin [Venturia canescens]
MRRLNSMEPCGAKRLEAELEAAREGLRDLDHDIRKIHGRELPNGGNRTAPRSPSLRRGQKRPLPEDRKRSLDFGNNDQPGGKRRGQPPPGEPKTVFSRLSARVPSNPDDSADEDDSAIKPAVPSRVIATPREVPSRQEVLKRERVDERSRQRNKRMFGALLGTLQKFRQEETKLKAKEDKKAEVEARVEEAKRREKEELRRERQQLFLSRKRQLAEVRALEAKLARSKEFQEWRAAQLPLASFIKTRAHPSIYYLPKRQHPRTDALLEQCAKELHEEVQRRETALTEELELIESQAGYGKNQQQYDGIGMPMQASEISQVASTEAEENRDPNPEPNVCNDQLSMTIDSKLSPKIVKEEMPLPIIQIDEIVDSELNNDKLMVKPEKEEMEEEEEEEEDQDHEDENNR